MATKKSYATNITTPEGKRIYVRGKTKEEFEKKLFETKVALGCGVNVTDNSTFTDYARLWLRTYKKDRVRPTSYTLSETLLEKHVIPFFGGVLLRDVRPMQIQYFLTSIQSYSKSTQSKCFALVKNVFKSAVDDGLIQKSPIRSEHKVVCDDPEDEQPLTDEQARRLLEATAGTQAYTFCLLALSTGMRRGEILGLMWEDVDFENNVIHVTHNKAFPMNEPDAPVTTLLKTEAARRDLPIGSVLREHLLSIHEQTDSPYVLHMKNGNSLTRSAFRSMWSAIDRRTEGKGRKPRDLGAHYGDLKVMLDFDAHPHQLRHTFITKLFEQGLDLKQVQYLAGHAKPEITLRIYTHYREAQRAAETHDQVVAALNYLAFREEARA